MSRCQTIAVLVMGIAGLLFVEPVCAEKLSKIEIAKLGKAATAFVEVSNRGTGTAFCIHPSGLFVTNEHVIGSRDPDSITLVLDTSLKSQRVLRARVVRVDKGLDLALLRAETEDALPSLQLGSVDEITELLEVVAFGFPLGRALSPDMKEYPAISVNSGKVTALRMKEGELQQVQIDVALTRGNSGGPVLDENGRVVGVVVSGVRSVQGINQAIPVSHLDRFLKVPAIQFTPPAITEAGLESPVEFQARIVWAIPTDKPADLELVLKIGTEAERRQKMELQDGLYRASTTLAQPMPAISLDVAAQFEKGTITGVVVDREILSGEQKIHLKACKSIQLQPKPQIVLRDGKVLEGVPTGLTEIPIQIGGQTVTLDLTKANSVQIHPPPSISEIGCTLIARQEDKEVGRLETMIPVAGAAVTTAASVDPRKVEIHPPQLSAEMVSKPLPDLAENIRVGGGGRFMVLHLPKLKKLAVFDITEARIVRYIPLAEDKIVYAAGLEKVVVGLTEKGIVERWDLFTGEKELTRAVPGAADVTNVLLGSASMGPVAINSQFFDLESFRPLSIKSKSGFPHLGSPISADGTVFGAWKTHQSPSESTTFVLQGNELLRYDSGGVGHVVPGADGRYIYTNKGPWTNQFGAVRGAPAEQHYVVPAVEGNYFLALSSAEGDKSGGVTVFLLGNQQPLVKDTGIRHGIRFDGWDREEFGPWRRIFFVPRANLIVIFPQSNDRLDLYHFDLDVAMEASGLDYLLVTSQPPRTARVGETLNYPVTVKAKHGSVTVRLDTGPSGMRVIDGNSVRWTVPADVAEGDQEVILTIIDGIGQELFHTFKLRVVK